MPFYLILLFVVLGGVLYLPLITQFGYYNDDWYSMYAARVAGPDIFHEVYSIDRPGRAYVMQPLYVLFQGVPLYYNLFAFALRVGGALFLLWLLKAIWPKNDLQTAVAALLFLAYPGFLNQPNAIDFQSHLVGIALAFLSLALMVKAINLAGFKKWFLYAVSCVTGLAYLSQMEYYIGFEAVRILLIVVIVSRMVKGFKAIIPATFKAWIIYSIVPGLYLFWRIFLFDNQRNTTDLGIQLQKLLLQPVVTLYDWVTSFVQSFLNVLFLAWGVPLSQIGFTLSTSDAMKGLLVGLAAILLTLAGLWYFLKLSNTRLEQDVLEWRREAFWLGFAWSIAGLIAVVMANRTVSFPEYSRYGLVSAPGAILMLVSALAYISERRIQTGVLAFMLFSAGMTHYGNSVNYANFWSDVRTFWWQVSWRIPQLEQGTTIVAHYPRGGIKESSSVWGPANQIYYPIQINPDTVHAGVHAALLNHDTVLRAFSGERQVYRKEIIVETYRNYRRLLLVIQPSPQSCVQVIDRYQLEYSANTPDIAILLGPYSEVENILADEQTHTPPRFLFGDEPEHGWCYYYEKADLARQRQDWEAVLKLSAEIEARGLTPNDPIEWLPFLQAYAYAGNLNRLAELAPSITRVPFVAQQVCNALKINPSLAQDVEKAIDENYCLPK